MPSLPSTQTAPIIVFTEFMNDLFQSAQTLLGAANSNHLSRDQLKPLISMAIRQHLSPGRVEQFSTSLRAIRSEGIDNSLVNSICEYSTLIAQRASRAWSIGAFVRHLIISGNIDLRTGGKAAFKVVRTYFLKLETDAASKNNIGECVALKKELRAFLMGLGDVNIGDFTKQRQWLENKNAAQLWFEETTSILKPTELTLDPSKDRSPRLV